MTTSTPRALALEYASRGYRVLATYEMVKTSEGKLVCSCWKGDRCGRSAGKHPHADISPHGSGSATSDLDEIRDWPERGYNVGWACNGEFMAIDIDDTKVAVDIMAPTLGLRDQLLMASTGRGVHVYIRCAEETAGADLKTLEGKRVGELRGLGQYVVLPPALHQSGKQYAWLKATLLDTIPQLYAEDGYSFASQLLGVVGVTLRPKKDAIDTEAMGGGIEPQELPFEPPLDSMLIRQMRTGTYPSSDRSSTLYSLACAVYRAASSSTIELDARTVAGVIKQMDRDWKHSKGPKFYGRADADLRYWQMATLAQQETASARADAEAVRKRRALPASSQPVQDAVSDALAPSDAPPAEPPNDDPPTLDDGLPPDDTDFTASYYWTRSDGFIDNTAGVPARAKRIANFYPEITEMLEVWDGESKGEDVWNVRLGRVHLLFTPHDREEVRAFMKRAHRALPPDHIVEPAMGERLFAGIKHYSLMRGRTTRRVAYAAPGWVLDQDKFLLPGAPGAITGDGFDESIRFESVTFPQRWMVYGANVGPKPESDIATSLSVLYNMSSHAVTVPLVMQILAAPLASLGGDRDAAVLHLHVKTGSLKTSMCRVAMSLYGEFNQSTKFDSWTATYAAVQGNMWRLRDLPYVLDDYKTGGGVGARTRDVTNIIQNYADRTGRARSSPNQQEQASQVARCLMVSTGEDVWDGQESTAARTIVVVPPLTTTPEARSLAFERITPAQALAADGSLGAIGYEWLRWLCGIGQRQLRQKLGVLQLEMRARAEKTALAQSHTRVAASLAGLLAVERLWQEFLDDRVPAFADEYRQMRGAAWQADVKIATERAEDSASFSPYQQLVTILKEGLSSGECRLEGRLGGIAGVGFQGAEVGGWVDEKYVWMTRETTLAWYERQMRSRGLSAVVSWPSFTQEARLVHGGYKPPEAVRVIDGKLRLFRLPREEVLGEENFVADAIKDADGHASSADGHGSATPSVDVESSHLREPYARFVPTNLPMSTGDVHSDGASDAL